MHQPWASLLVHGIKRIEGRSWSAPVRGRLWIHAAGKVPDPATIKAMEEFYKEIYAVDGVTDIEFPEHYPVSQLLGCVNVVGCVKCEELVCWEELPKGVRLEGQTDCCWLCEDPQKLLVPFEMRGYQGVYNLEKKIFASAVRGLRPVQSPLPVKFPLPDPSNPFSLRPGALAPYLGSSMENLAKPPSLNAAIAGARAAATQFSRKEQPARFESSRTKSDGRKELGGELQSSQTGPYRQKDKAAGANAAGTQRMVEEDGSLRPNENMTHRRNRVGRLELNQSKNTASSSRIFATAVRDLKPN